MVVVIEKRKIELRIRGSHGPPNAEEQARMMLKSCCKETSRASRRQGLVAVQPTTEKCESQVMAEVTVTKYGPHE